MTRTPPNHQTGSNLSDALREQHESKSKDPPEQAKLIDDTHDAGATVPRRRLLGPETATPRRWVNHARPDNERPTPDDRFRPKG
jgi:hypothetical protein